MNFYCTKQNFIILIIIISMGLGIVLSHPKKVKRKIASTESPSVAGEKCGLAISKLHKPTENLILQDKVLKQAITEAFKTCLTRYIRIKTVSPYGNEHKAVEFFESVFSILDIPHKRFYVDDLNGIGQDHRVNFIASLSTDRSQVYNWEAKKKKKSIILLNHMDVVDAIAQQWEKPELAWSGMIASSEKYPNEQFIWGRGALDMKSVGITQMINLYLLKIMNIKFKRDIHFLAVADEEAASSGAIGAIQKMQKGEELYALSSASLVLNEGGGGIKDTPSTGWDLFLLASEEKGGAWLKFEEPNPIQLMKDLYKSKIIMIDDRISRNDPRITGHECQVRSIHTPQAKANVIASKVIVDFSCKKGFQVKSLFENVFKHNFKNIKTEVKQVNENVKLTIESNSSSHGATGINESAMDALVMGLYHLNILDIKKNKKKPSYFDYIKTSATRSLIKGIGKSNFLLNIINRLSWIPFIKRLMLKEVENSFGLDGLFRTTCQFSAINFNQENINDAQALVDCRLLHTALDKRESKDSPREFIKQLKRQIKNKNLDIKLISGRNFSYSPVRNKDFLMIKKTLEAISRYTKRRSKTVATAYLFPAGTDSTWFRNPFSNTVGVDMEPIPSYGFYPLYMTDDLLATYHGSNERFPISQIPGTVERYLLVLKKLAQRTDLSIINRAKNNIIKMRQTKKIKSKAKKLDTSLIQKKYKGKLKIIEP